MPSRPRSPRVARARGLAGAILALASAACDSETATSPQVQSQAVGGKVLVAPNPYSALSSIVTFEAALGDSARVVSVTPGDSSATPYTVVQTNPVRIVTLGLLPSRTYTQTIEIKNPQGFSGAERAYFTTGDLPSYVKRATLTTTYNIFSGGYTLVSPIGYEVDTALAVAFDSVGRVRWYRLFPGNTSVELKQQPNDHFSIYLNYLLEEGTSAANSAAPNGAFVEFLPSGDSLRSYSAANGLATDVHELWLSGGNATVAGTAHLFGVDTRTADITPIGGPAGGLFGGHWIFRVGPQGAAEYAWDAWDHYVIADCLFPYAGAGGDFDHPNSLDFDLDSNYIVSFRNMSAIVKLDYHTSATIWQLGGTRNQFRILNDPQAQSFGGTSGQHSVRVLPNGHLLIYDDGNLLPVPHTRAVEYALDPVAKTATMVWQYLPNPPIFTPAVGSVQRLPNGHTLVGFGLAGVIHEVNAAAHLVATAGFTLNGSASFYRATRIQSLYHYIALNGR